MASGWNLWVWLQCIGVAIVGIVVRRYIGILIIFPTPLVLGLFLTAASLLLCSFSKGFFGLVYIYIYTFR